MRRVSKAFERSSVDEETAVTERNRLVRVTIQYERSRLRAGTTVIERSCIIRETKRTERTHIEEETRNDKVVVLSENLVSNERN